MADDRTLKILLQVKSDVADLNKVVTGLKGVEAQATQTNAALSKSGVGVGGGNVQLQTEINALTQRQAQLLGEMTGTSGANLALTQETAVAQALIERAMEKRVIIELQLEAAEARMAGNPALAAKLDREVVVRTRALTIQQALNISTEESIILAERLIVAQEAGGVASAVLPVNLNKARAEALQLGKEIAFGGVNTRTLGALLGSLGSTLTIAGIAGYGLYSWISRSADETVRMAQEMEKNNVALDKSVREMIEIAKAARGIADEIKIADKIRSELDKAQLELAKFRAEENEGWARWSKGIAEAMRLVPGLNVLAKGVADNAQAEAKAKTAEAQERITQRVRSTVAAEIVARSEAEKWAFAQTHLNQGIATYTQKVEELGPKVQAAFEAMEVDPSEKNLENFRELSTELKNAQGNLKELTAEQEKLNRAEERSGRRAEHLEVTTFLREESTLLQGIQQEQQLISQDRFLSADEKDRQLLALIVAEMKLLNGEIIRGKEFMDSGTLDPATYERVEQKVQQLIFKFQSLGQKIKTLGFSGDFKAQLSDWVNNFGTAGQQAANVITNTLGSAIQGISRLLTDAIFRTGDWKQALLGIGEAGVQSLIEFGLQLVIQNTLGRALHTTAAAANIAETTAQIPPAATLAATEAAGTWGVSAIVGTAIAAALIGALIATLVGGFEEGGYTGRRRRKGKIAGVVHDDEFVFHDEATRNIGIDNLYAMMQAAEEGPVHFVGGGVARGYPGGRVPATIRNYNPGGIDYGPFAIRHGATGYERIGGGHLIATFPDLGTGTAAQMALLRGNYVGLTLTQAVTRWVGTYNPDYIAAVSRKTGLAPNDIVTSDPATLVAFSQAAAVQEGGRPGALGSSDVWQPTRIERPDQGITLADIDDEYDPADVSGRFSPTEYGGAPSEVDSTPPADYPYGVNPYGVPYAGPVGNYPYGVNDEGVPYAGPVGDYPYGVNPDGVPYAGPVGDFPYGVNPYGVPYAGAVDAPYGVNEFGVPYAGPVDETDNAGGGSTGYGSGGPGSFGHGIAGFRGLSGNAFTGGTGRMQVARVYNASGQMMPGPGYVGGLMFGNPPVDYMGQQGRYASGTKLPGSPSTIDTIPAMLAAGERVVDSGTESLLTRTYGSDWVAHLKDRAVSAPSLRLAAGGVAGGGQRSEGRGQRSEGKPTIVQVLSFTDPNALLRHMQSSDAARMWVVNTFNSEAHQIR